VPAANRDRPCRDGSGFPFARGSQVSNASWNRVLAQVRRLSGNALLLTVSQVLPLIAAVISLPFIYRNIGREEFGAFSIALSILGMFVALDLGLGRSAVRFMSRAFAAQDRDGAATIAVHSALWLGGFSLVLTVILIPLVEIAAERWFDSSGTSRQIVVSSLYLVLLSWPLLALTPALRAVLEAREEFGKIAFIQSLTSSLTYVAPLLLSFVSGDIRVIVGAAVVSRCLGPLFFLWHARRAWGGRFPWRAISSDVPKEFRQFSAWVVVSHLTGGAIIPYGDRALLMRIFPLDTVAFYNVPLEFLSRFLIIVNNAAMAAFPVMSRYTGDSGFFERTYLIVITAASALLGMLLVAVSVLAPAGLELWLGEEFRENSTGIVRILLVGLMCWSLNAIAHFSLNAQGFARAIAVMHLIEVPIYFLAMYVCGVRFGLYGVAAVWSARMLVEYVCFSVYRAVISGPGVSIMRRVAMTLVALNVLPLGIVAAADEAWLTAMAVSLVVASASFLWIASVVRKGYAAASPL